MRRPRRLWVIDPSRAHAERQGVSETLAGFDGESRLFRPALRPGDGPRPGTGYDYDGVVLLGSAASVFDRDAWIADLAAWLAPVLSGEVARPLLGICFGHQLIAHLVGGGVRYRRPDHAKLLGIESTRVEGSRLFPEGRVDLRVVVSHREEVHEPPSDYRRTALRDSCAIDGLEHPSLPIFSFQFHPEARDEFASHSGLDPALIDARVREDGRRVLHAFHEVVQRTARSDKA